MFWIETIKHGRQFCFCELNWKTIKIINYKIFHDFLEVYLTPENGEKVCFLKIRNGESISNLKDFIITSIEWQHMKMEVFGGEISICGKITKYETPKFIPDTYDIKCVFAEPEAKEDWEWIESEIAKKEEIKRTRRHNGERLQSNIDSEKEKLLQKRCEEYIAYIRSLEDLEHVDLFKKIINILESMLPIQIENNEYIKDLLSIYYIIEKLMVLVEADNINERNKRYEEKYS
jgi:hypothetical protein